MSVMRCLAVAAMTLLLSACVTINVYFPAAAAEQAAQEFIEKVIGEDAAARQPNAGASLLPAHFRLPLAAAPQHMALAALFISSAQAQADINIRTPQIRAIQDRMAERFQSQLRTHFESGAIGLGSDGLIEVRDASEVPLRERNALTQLVAEENRDRAAVYREIAVANGHPEWESQIRQTFARQWIDSARAGWYYKDGSGNWQRK